MGVIESLLEELNSTLTGRSRDSTKKARVRLAAAFGAYLGEVLRRADGGKWETTRSQVPGAPSIGLQCGDLTVFPLNGSTRDLRTGRPKASSSTRPRYCRAYERSTNATLRPAAGIAVRYVDPAGAVRRTTFGCLQ